MTEEKKEKRSKIIGPFEWITLLLGIGLIGYLTLHKAGYKMVERSAETTFIDPSNSHQLSPAPRKTSKSEVQVNKMLAEMAATFNENQPSQNSSTASNSMQQKWNLSESEASFYDKIQKNSTWQDKFQSTSDWFKFLNTSRKTYLELENLFSELSPNQKAETSAKAILENEAAASDFYQKMEDRYDLPNQEAYSFFQQGKNNLEDWAAFLVQRSYSKQ